MGVGADGGRSQKAGNRENETRIWVCFYLRPRILAIIPLNSGILLIVILYIMALLPRPGPISPALFIHGPENNHSYLSKISNIFLADLSEARNNSKNTFYTETGLIVILCEVLFL